MRSPKAALEPFRAQLVAVAVESTFNWYWLVDGLMDAGYEVRLVHTGAVVQYDGLKHTDDEHDAFWLAHLMRLGILPTGYIYPKSERGLRDLAQVELEASRTADGPTAEGSRTGAIEPQPPAGPPDTRHSTIEETTLHPTL